MRIFRLKRGRTKSKSCQKALLAKSKTYNCIASTILHLLKFGSAQVEQQENTKIEIPLHLPHTISKVMYITLFIELECRWNFTNC